MRLINCKKRSTPIDGNELAYKYFNDIRRFKVLSDEEQRALLYKVKHGTKSESADSRRKLIESNQRFIASVAKHLAKGNNFNDLVSEGNIGLDRAIDKFDLSFPQKFLSYASFWVNKYMVDYMVTVEKMVVPKNANKAYTYVSSARNRFFLEHCRFPTIEELQDILKDEGIVFVNEADLLDPNMFYLDESENLEDENELRFRWTWWKDYNDISAQNNIETWISDEYANKLSESMLAVLPERQRIIVQKRYGIGCHDESVGEIANDLGINNRTVLRDLDKALTRIRKRVKVQI